MDRARLRVSTPPAAPRTGRGSGTGAPGKTRALILGLFEAHGALAPIELSERIGITRGVIGFHLGNLEREGQIKRTLRAGRLCYMPADAPEVDLRAARPEAMARKLKTLQQLQMLFEPRIAQVLREIEADYQSGLVGAPAGAAGRS